MKSIVISVLMLSMTLLFVSCENESQLTQSTSDVEKQILDKKPIRSDWIKFTGDLMGDQEVFGCCPNAGPSPEYTMILSNTFPEDFQGEHWGNLFINSFGRNMPWDYKVQFWWGGENEYFIVIRGGETEWDKKAGWLKVTFDEEPMLLIDPNDDSTYVDVTFILTKQKLIKR